MKGFSSQVRLFPVVFESGEGALLRDVDGNTYLDFSSGIYVTGLGHCHPKITEAVQNAAGTLMNCHDFTTPIKMRLLEKLAEITMGEGNQKLTGMQLYDSGTTAVEAGLRVMRAATGKFEFISFHGDFHGKTMGAVGLAQLDVSQGLRAPGFFLVPRGNCYRCAFKQTYPECNLMCVDYIPHGYQRGDLRANCRHCLRACAGVGRERCPAGWLGAEDPPGRSSAS